MSIIKHYIETASVLIDDYSGDTPLHLFLKHFFSQHKKYGSRDRKTITNLCYYYYRMGKALPGISFDKKLTIALFLCSNKPSGVLSILNPAWNENASLPLEEKLEIAGGETLLPSIFPFTNELSASLHTTSYSTHILTQPDVFIRIRPGKKINVLKKLNELGWTYKEEGPGAIRLASGLQVDKNFVLNKEVVVQDLNSQQVGNIMQNVFHKNNFIPKNVWDCCAASGGKSIMLHDLYPGIDITVSDIRSSILHNLIKRFKEAGISKYRSFIADISSNSANKMPDVFSLIFADVPCTGSGTWARTPEQLYFFDVSTIEVFAAKQFAIVTNLVKHLQPGGWLVYVTCSVFKKENEDVIEKLVQNHSLNLIHSQMIDGTKQRADSMYVAIMQLE